MAEGARIRRRLVFIVSRERLDLYESLRKALWNEPDCEVLVDRREGDRRAHPLTIATGDERRARNRRERIPVDNEVRECGWAVVKITTWPEAVSPPR
jgi:hypothetical protein